MNLIIVVILYFILSSVTTNCNINKSSGAIVKFKPPNIIFSIVWPIIFILLYLSSNETKNLDYLYYFLICSFFLWPISYGCNNFKYLGVYSILISYTILTYIQNESNSKYLPPIQTWLLLALLINLFEVQLE